MAKSIAFKRAAKENGMDEESFILSRMATNFARRGIETDNEKKDDSGQVTLPGPAGKSVAFKRAAEENNMDTESYFKDRITRFATQRYGVDEKDLPDLTKTAAQREDERQRNEYNRLLSLDLDTSRSELETLSAQLEEAKKAKNSANFAVATSGRYAAMDEVKKRSAALTEAAARYDELNKKVTELNREIRTAQLYQDDARYKAYLNEQDYSQYTGREKPDDAEYMTDEEIGIYNYVLNKFGDDSAEEFLDYMKELVNYRKGTERGEEIMDIDSNALRFLALGAHAGWSGVSNFGRGIRQLFTDEALPTSATQYADQYIVEDLGESGWKVPLTDRTLGQLAYEGTSTITNMMPSFLAAGLVTYATGGLGAPAAAALTAGSIAGSTTLGLSAGGNAYTQAIKDGYTEDQARTYGTMIGASEATLQAVLGGIGKLAIPGGVSSKLLTKVAGIENGLLRAAASGGVMYASELAEEELQLYLEPLYRTLIFDEAYDAPEVEDIVYTAAVTLLTTGTMNAGEIISASKNNFAQNGNQIASVGDESVRALIESGLESDKHTDSYKLAEQLQNKLNKGKTLSEYEIGRLQQLNMEAIEAEASQSASDPLMDLARETVAARENAAQTQADAAVEGSSRSNVPYNVLSMENPVRKARDNAIKNTGYGENGIKAFTAELDRSGESVDQVRAKFQTAYESGLTGIDRSKVNFQTQLQENAFMAGAKDYLANVEKNTVKTTVIHRGGFLNIKDAPKDISKEELTWADKFLQSLAVEGRFGADKGNASITDSGKMTVAPDFGISNEALRELGNMDHIEKVAKLAHTRGVSLTGVLSHEAGLHRAMQLAPKQTLAFINRMYEYMGKELPASLATLAEEKQDAYGRQDVSLSLVKAIEEVVADGVVDLYGDKGYREMTERIMSGNDQQAKTGLQKFVEAIGEIVERFKQFVAKLTGKEKTEAKKTLDELQELRDLYEDALKAAMDRVKAERANNTEATKNAAQTSDGDVQHSAKEYSAIREKIAKTMLDKISDMLGEQFPLSARFDAYIKNTKDVVSSPAVTADAVELNGRSYFKAAKDEFVKHYKKGETVNMAGTGIMAALKTDVATESISKRMSRGGEQVLLDVIPHAKSMIEGGKLFGIERLRHTDNKNAGLFAYRVYNAFDYVSTDATTKTATTTPYVFVATVVQQYDGNSVVHIIRGIEIATYDRGKLGKSDESSAITGGKYKVAQLYKFVKSVPRDDGGLKYTAKEANDYLFTYTQKESGEQYSLKDSTGRTLSPGQQEYFKDSKVRDEDGNLKVMYHGTPSGDFTVFKDGSYFTGSKEYADRYQSPSASSISVGKEATAPKTFAVYLDIKKPFDITDPEARDIYINEYIKGGNAMGINPYLSDAEYRKIKTVDWTEGEDLRDFLIDNGYDYDGLVLDEGADGGYGDEVAYRGQSYVVFSPEQVKDIDNLNPTDDPDIQFSLKVSRESGKNLLAIHNKNAESIMAALDLGGFPMPSIAIVKNDVGHEEFGDISVLFRKDTIDPQASRRNKVYGADAWTPTKPSVGYKVSDKVRERIYSRVRKLLEGTNLMSEFALMLDDSNMDDKMRRWDGDFKVAYGDNPALKIAYLKDVGVAFNPVMKDKNYSHDADNIVLRRISRALGKGKARELMNAGFKEIMKQEPLIRKLMNDRYEEQGYPRIYDEPLGFSTVDNVVRAANNYEREGAAKEIDTHATKERLEKKFTKKVQADYEAWLDELSSGIIEKKGLRNNKDMFTPSGNRRSFEQLYMEFNLDNIVKAMAEESEKGGGVLGTGNIFGAATKEYSSIADIKADSDRLVMQDEETHKAEHDAFVARLQEITNAMIMGDGGFGAALDAGDAAVDALLRGKTVKGILRELKSWRRFNATEQIAQDIYDLAQDISEAPTTYFEAKPRRAVGFDEVAAVVMPRNSSAELKTRLEDMGIQVLTYNPNKEGDRLKKINSVDNISFSLKEQNDLLKENAKLKEVNEGLREQFKTTTFAKVDKKSLDKFTKQLLKDYQSGADINEIRDALNDVYTYMANGEDGQSPAWNDLQERAYNVAVSILENASTVNDEMYQAYKSLRDRLRNYPISIDKAYNNDIQGYESINDFRKANFGRLKISNDGTPVDIVYSDLANTYPEFFDETEYTTQADQLTHIADVLDSLQPYEVNPYSSDMRRAATWLASDIIERFYELPQAKPTFADKQAAKLTKQVIKDAKKLENLREKKNERIKDLIQKNREKVKATTQKERAKRVEAVKEIKDHYKAKEKKASESRKARELRAKIMRHAQDMSKKLLKPTDKQHIPQKLQGAVAKLLESINLESNYTYDPNSQSYKRNDDGLPSQRTKAFAELRKLYAEMANELVIDPDLLGEDGLLSDVAALADKRIADMTSEELETVYQTMRAVEASISSANKAFAESRWASIEEAAESIREENKDKRQVTEYAGVVGWGQKLTGLDMMTPNAFFHRLGESGDAIFRMMRDAQDKHIKLMKAVEDFTHKELKDVPVKKWEKEIRTVKLGGEDVQLTTAQIMELYVLTKRKQAQDHIFMGGILPETVANKGIKKISRAEPVRGIDIGEVSKAVAMLTEEQKKVADKLQQFASTELSRWGNEAAMQVYNYEKFNEPVYWPIRSNRQEIASTVEKDTQVTSVAGRGFSKNTKPNANTSVKIGSIFDTFASHSSEMATYAAWLAPAEDINRIRNYTFLNEEGGRAGTVKGIIERIHGSRGTQYLQKLLSDIANGVGAGRGNETRMDQIVGNYKASAIGANLRVIIQQPTALLRALDMIGPQYIASTKSPLSGWKKAKKYAPIAQWKDWGYFDINTGRQMKDVLFDTDGALDKVKQFTMAGAGLADSISWGMLWNAVENEVKANRKSLKPGTEEFYKAVAARFTEIVDRTQVVDGILQRSQIMRSADGLTKMATSFMGEPTKQYNMVMSALYDLRHTEGRERTIARKRFGRTVTALVVSGVVNAMAQSIIDAVRDDDDEKEYWEKWLTAFFGLEGDEETLGEKAKAVAFGSNLMNIFNPAGYIPYAKDVGSIFQGYDVSRMDMESIEKTISSWNNLWKAINGEGNYTIQGASINFIAEAARLFGVPAANLKREIVSFTTMIAQGSDSFLMQYHIEKFFTNPVNSSKGVLDILYNAYATDKDEFDALYKRMLKDDELKTEDKTTAEVIAGKLKGRVIEDLYELYKNDPDAYEEMYDDLIERDFLKTGVKTDDPETDTFKSTAEHIASAMESLMKDEQGVDKVKDLESRYFGPDQQREYDSKMREIQSSGVWKNANAEQRDKLEDNLRRVVLESDEDMLETIEEGAAYGLDDTEYLLYKLALETVDQPNENGKYGTYSNAEKAAAISSLDVGDGETAFLWNTDQAFEAFGYGIGMDKYVTFKTEVSNIKADKDRRGKTIAGSRKKKIIAYLNSLGVSYKEYLYLLGTEYDLSKDKDYRKYFGE